MIVTFLYHPPPYDKTSLLTNQVAEFIYDGIIYLNTKCPKSNSAETYILEYEAEAVTDI